MVNLLPLAEGETISTVLPLPEDEAEWGGLHIMFATANGTVRRNSMDAFTNIPRAGKIAMRFGAVEDRARTVTSATDRLIGVSLADRRATTSCSRRATARRSASRRPTCASSSRALRRACAASACRPATRSSRCRSCTASATTQEEREAYLRCAAVARARRTSSARSRPSAIAELADKEQFILTVDRERLRQAHLGL